jgi:hypothetical protein
MGKTTGSVAGLICRGIDNLRELLPPEFPEIT